MKLKDISPQCTGTFWVYNLIQIFIASISLVYVFFRLNKILTLNNYLVILVTYTLIIVKFIIWTLMR